MTYSDSLGALVILQDRPSTRCDLHRKSHRV